MSALAPFLSRWDWDERELPLTTNLGTESPQFREWIFSFLFRSRILWIVFSRSLPVRKFWEWIFSCYSRPWIWEMGFLNPFPFPNLLFHIRESNWNIVECIVYGISYYHLRQNNRFVIWMGKIMRFNQIRTRKCPISNDSEWTTSELSSSS